MSVWHRSQKGRFTGLCLCWQLLNRFLPEKNVSEYSDDAPDIGKVPKTQMKWNRAGEILYIVLNCKKVPVR